MTKRDRKHQLSDSAVIERIPLACSNELAAVEFLEQQRWGANPCCVHCGSVNVYKMVDAKTGERNSRYLWRCRDCKQQYTVNPRFLIDRGAFCGGPPTKKKTTKAQRPRT